MGPIEPGAAHIGRDGGLSGAIKKGHSAVLPILVNGRDQITGWAAETRAHANHGLAHHKIGFFLADAVIRGVKLHDRGLAIRGATPQ